VRQTQVGGDRRHLEIDLAGEGSGEIPGQHVGTLAVETSGDPSRPNSWTYRRPARKIRRRGSNPQAAVFRFVPARVTRRAIVAP
jgi:hypothetical protein